MTRAEYRQILHVDMDAFYAAVEQRDRPELRGRPVLVGGDPNSRGVVSTASYEARRFGCASAMPTATALRLCPQAVVVRPRMSRYAGVSRAVFAILEQFTPLVEPLSIDEAFLDVSGSVRLFGSGVTIGAEIKRRVHERTNLTASVGVAPNKFIAKLASDHEKPDGLVVVEAARVPAFLDPLPASRLWGVGKQSLARLEAIGVRTFADVRRMAESELRRRFGQAGEHYYRLVRGIDDRPVVPDREAKSISHETTFAADIADVDYLRQFLLQQLEQVAERLRRHELTARTVFIKLRTPAFETLTRRLTLEIATDRTDVLWRAAAQLFAAWRSQRASALRLLGVGVTQLSGRSGQQIGLFEQREDAERRRLDRTVDQIRQRFGREALTRGRPARKRED